MKKNVLGLIVVMLSVASSLGANQIVVAGQQKVSILIDAVYVEMYSNNVYNKKVEAKYSKELAFLDTEFRKTIDNYDGENPPSLLLVNFDTDSHASFNENLLSFDNIVDAILVTTKDEGNLNNTQLYTYLIKKGYKISSESLEIVKKSDFDFAKKNARASYDQIVIEDNEYEEFIKLNKGLKTFTYVQISIQ